jgi:hypothetical protein
MKELRALRVNGWTARNCSPEPYMALRRQNAGRTQQASARVRQCGATSWPVRRDSGRLVRVGRPRKAPVSNRMRGHHCPLRLRQQTGERGRKPPPPYCDHRAIGEFPNRTRAHASAASAEKPPMSSECAFGVLCVQSFPGQSHRHDRIAPDRLAVARIHDAKPDGSDLDAATQNRSGHRDWTMILL